VVDETLGDLNLGDLIATLGSIDDDEIDWQNVARNTVLIHQTFRYDYPGSIASLRQRLMVVPPDYHDDQRLVTHKLRVSGCDVDTERSYDTFGNVVLDLTLQRVEREVEFTSWIVVEREAGADGALYSEPLSPDARFAEPSRLTRPDAALTTVAAELEATGAKGLDLADLVNQRVHEQLRYDWGITSIATTAAEAWAGGAGVCQDYAHCMLALARLCGLSARYVSGHLLGEGGTHAWVEILVAHPREPECVSAIAFDPTHARRAGLRYVTVAVGRDYADVAPTSGTYEGPSEGVLTTSKRAAVTNVEYLRPQRRRRIGPLPTA
jgi:transglutaminase-like putative cysteine protease